MPSVKMDGAKGTKDFRVREPNEQRAVLYRLGAGVNETIMVQSGSHQRVATKDEINQIDTDDNVVFRDHLETHQTILEVLKKYSVMGIHEDYPAYKASNFNPR